MDQEQVVAEVVAATDAPDPAPEQPAEPETVTLPKAEADALRRRVAEAEKATRKFEADTKKAEEARAAEEGKWKELAEARERELGQANDRAQKLERDQRIARIASRMKFLDPTDVIGRVSAEDGQDDGLTESALARIAESSPHLIAKEAAVTPEIGQVLTPSAVGAPSGTADGKPAPPTGKAPLRSLDEWEALPQAERRARMDEADWLQLHET